MLGIVRYRLWQFWQGVQARSLPDEAWHEIEMVLSAREMALFERFLPADQSHSYRVMQTLYRAGHRHPALLTAALLHDIGKTKIRLQTWARLFTGLVELVSPRIAAAWGQGKPNWWRHGFVIKAQHPAWGAAMTEAVGTNLLTVALIRRHQDNLGVLSLPAAAASLEEQLLQQLQWADDQN